MWFKLKKPKITQKVENRYKQLKSEARVFRISWKIWIALGGFFASICFLSFYKQNPIGPQLYLNQTSKIHLVSAVDFEYVSILKTDALKEQRHQAVSPVYKVDTTHFNKFSQAIDYLKTQLDACTKKQIIPFSDIIKNLDNQYGIQLSEEDLQILLKVKSKLQRDRYIDEGLFILQEVVAKGIFNDVDLNENGNGISFNEDYYSEEHFLSKGNALRVLRMNLFVMNIDYEFASALIHIFRYGLVPNLVYDRQKTQEKVNRFVAMTPNVIVKIPAGSVIASNGQMVTPEIFECYQAYQDVLSKLPAYKNEQKAWLLKKIFVLSLLLFIFILAFQFIPTRIKISYHLQIVIGSVLILNIALIRLVKIFCQYSSLGQRYCWLAFVPVLVPTFLSSVLITTLTDILIGFLCVFLVVGVKTLIVYGSLESFLFDFLTGVLIVFLCKQIKSKKDFVRAIFYGLGLNMCLLFVYEIYVQHLSFDFCLKQGIAFVLNGLITSIIVINLLAFLEKTFRYTTNITFLNLMNLEHPLLNKLQMLAPGTYHHSLQVATLAEKVASEVGANALLCRCCALYHDIGKLIKPEYFTENQKGDNPHQNQLPSMSAIVLKSHVKEGVELAKTYKLPRVIVDVIKQHHGTSKMKYFYKKALLMKKEGEIIDEKIFCYDGPKPQFKESAIISLADSIEAASRSLEKITAQSVEDLVDGIIKDRIETEQFNECAITLRELDTIRKSFKTTLLSMMHSRISYDKIEEGIQDTSEKSDSKNTQEI